MKESSKPSKAPRWHLVLLLELIPSMKKVRIELAYHVRAELTINLTLAQQLIESNNRKPFSIDGGRLIAAEGIDQEQGRSVRQIGPKIPAAN